MKESRQASSAKQKQIDKKKPHKARVQPWSISMSLRFYSLNGFGEALNQSFSGA